MKQAKARSAQQKEPHSRGRRKVAQPSALSARRIDQLRQNLTAPLRTLLRGYQEGLCRLHPFESTLAQLTLSTRQRDGAAGVDAVFAGVQGLRADLAVVGKQAVAAAKDTRDRAEAERAEAEGIARLKEALGEGDAALQGLVALAQSLRALPSVQHDRPMVVLVGMPNVGKSTIVRAISSGTPEVNHYPFTTRGITVGHVQSQRGDMCQVMDTPGLLHRADSERNLMEQMTLSAMRDLPSAILYVTDLSGTCGPKSPAREQLELRDAIRAQFVHRPWQDIISKSDLEWADEVHGMDAAGRLESLKEEAITLSAPLGTGMGGLRVSVAKMLEHARVA